MSKNLFKTPYISSYAVLYLSELSGLTALKKLRLNDNALTMLPASIGTMVSLEELELENNFITAVTLPFLEAAPAVALKIVDGALKISGGFMAPKVLRNLRRLVLTNNKIISVCPGTRHVLLSSGHGSDLIRGV